MAESISLELQRENAELRQRLDQLRKRLNSVFEPRMPDNIGPVTKSRMINSMSPTEIGPHLREVALRCQRLARQSTDARATRELQDIGIELADRASSLETIFTMPDTARSR
jgi:hypothetical protein